MAEDAVREAGERDARRVRRLLHPSMPWPGARGGLPPAHIRALSAVAPMIGVGRLSLGEARRLLPSRAREAIGWGTADQALSSLTNFALSLFVARSASVREFGVFGLLFTAYLLVLGLSRALSSDVLLVRFSAASSEESRHGAAAATGTAGAVGLATGVALALASFAVEGPAHSAALALAVALPGLLVQDCWRFAFFARGVPKAAFANDGIAALALAVGLAVIELSGVRDLVVFIVAWGAAAGLGAVAGCAQAGLRPQVGQARAWLLRHRSLALPYAGDFFSYFGSGQLATYAVTVFGGLSAAAALRGAGVLLGPLNVLFMGIGNIAVPEGVRRRSSRRSLLRWTLPLSSCLALAALAWTGAVLLLPASVGHAALGDSWQVARPVLLPLGLAMAGSGFASGAIGGLRALAVARTSLLGRLLSAPLVTVGVLVGSPFGAVSAVAAMAATQWTAAGGVWWPLFLRSLPRGAAEATAPGKASASAV